MSERTAPALAAIEGLLAAIAKRPDGPATRALVDEAEALKRAVGAFHMEAIRFRMYSVDRLLAAESEDTEAKRRFADVRHALETAGFHTRSHAAP